MAVLVVNRNDSKCSACGGNAFPEEAFHVNGPRNAPGCGEPFTALSSHYVGMDAVVQSMRPDLPWIAPGS